MAAALAAVQRRMFGTATTPARVGRYLLLERIGQGGMGVVHRAYDPELDRKVALKLVRQSAQAESTSRLKREAQSLARVKHRNVVAVHDVGSTQVGHETVVFIVMELVEGRTLREWLAEKERPLAEIVRVFVAAARGLVAAHAHGIVHRDFKPSNVIIDQEGEPHVLDFGLARAFGRGKADVASRQTAQTDGRTGSPLATPLTRVGTILGTPPYMAPEQLLAGSVDARADQYALSVALFEALHGMLPFQGAGRALLELKLAEQMERPGRRIPRHIADVIVRGLHAAPDARFPDLESWIRALAHDPRRARQRWMVGGVLFSLALVGHGLHQAASESAYSACLAARTLPTSPWNQRVRRELEAQFVDAAPTFGADTFAWLDRDLASHVRWVERQRVANCDAMSAGAQAPTVTRLRAACFDRIDARLAGIIEGLRGAGPSAVLSVGDLAIAPDLKSCGPDRVESVEGSPTSEADIERELGRGEALLQIGDVSAALALASRLREQVGDDIALGIRVKLFHGRILHTSGDTEDAERVYTAALLAADAAGRDSDAALAMAWLADAIVSGQGDDPARRNEAERWLALAEGRLGRVAATGTLRNLLLGERADMLVAAHRYEEAVEVLLSLVDVRVDMFGGDHPSVASARDALGAALDGAHRGDEALVQFETALRMRKHVFGEAHPAVGRSLNNLALVYAGRGREDEGVALLEQAREIDEETLGAGAASWVVKTINLGHLSLRLDNSGEARAYFEAALDAIEDGALPHGKPFVLAKKGLGMALLRLGDRDAATVQLFDALDVARTRWEPGDAALVSLEAELATTLDAEFLPI